MRTEKEETPPGCPFCGEELVAMAGGFGCPLTQSECDDQARARKVDRWLGERADIGPKGD
jgi:tRNA(Ile2) C34 agmatinyltransferase TiaS